jgi:hypothetical protein
MNGDPYGCDQVIARILLDPRMQRPAGSGTWLAAPRSVGRDSLSSHMAS